MKIKQFEVKGLAQYSYIVSSGNEAVAIDPTRDFGRYIDYAAARGLTIRQVTETHIHADFASGAAALAEAVGAELALSAYTEGEQYRYGMRHRGLRDGDELRCGTATLRVLHTPGHTPEHLSFVLYDGERGASEAVAAFTGDFLFVGSLGRPDLLGEGEKRRLARELYRSLHERIAALPDGIQVYPGHGAGSFCGAGMSDRGESTLGYERATQLLFRLAEEAFVTEILASVPPMPSYYPRMKRLNAEGAPSMGTPAAAKALSAREFALAVSDGVTVLDLRRPEAFGGAHLGSSINIGAGQNLSLWAGWMLDAGKPILLVGDDGDDEASRRALARVGLDKVEGFLAKGMPAWIEAGLDFVGLRQLSTADLQSRDAAALVLDVRSYGEWRSGRIPGARHIPLGELPDRLDEVPRDRPVIAVCGSGYRSSVAGSLLLRGGFGDVASMNGGMTAWKARGWPVER